MKSNDIELREQCSYDSIDNRKVSTLEEELEEFIVKINAAAQKYIVFRLDAEVSWLHGYL